jgi:tetratricopeptide (TPR) repeat protein
MPFGKKPDAAGVVVDFDAVYGNLIAPAVVDAGMEPLRADEEMSGGVIHKPMFERLILCEYAVADLTTANANVFYELGLRHAVRPWSTILIFSKGGSQLPFDVAPLRAMPYQLGADGTPTEVETTKGALTARLAEARRLALDKPATDSPIYQLVEDYPNVSHEKTDVFREQVRYSAERKGQLAVARKQGLDAVRATEAALEPIGELESGVAIDLFLSYRAVKGWQEMVNLVQKIPRPLASTVMVREQLALALNRLGRRDEAERVLNELLESRGPSSETYGIFGRVYKDRWEEARDRGARAAARGLLDKAIGAYLKGFETDWRDAYPGVNAVTLMELKEPPDPRREKLVTVVSYAVERRVAAGKPDYWDYATQLELAVLSRDGQAASGALSNALASIREKWEPETTLRNLRLIREARERRQETIPDWVKEVEEELGKATL